VADYLPHTPEEVDEMLRFLGMDSLEQLFAHIPSAVRLSQGLDLPAGMSEPDVAANFTRYTDANRAQASKMLCFAGAGAYDHEVPAVVKMLSSRSEFVTAYTPYQPEVAQGVLQAIFRVPDFGVATERSARRQRVALRRGDRHGRGAQHGPRGPPVERRW
jgi:glycine dehydrogenase subunit 1